jgi:hypothetical protein
MWDVSLEVVTVVIMNLLHLLSDCFYPEDGRNSFLRNVCKDVENCKAHIAGDNELHRTDGGPLAQVQNSASTGDNRFCPYSYVKPLDSS